MKNNESYKSVIEFFKSSSDAENYLASMDCEPSDYLEQQKIVKKEFDLSSEDFIDNIQKRIHFSKHPISMELELEFSKKSDKGMGYLVQRTVLGMGQKLIQDCTYQKEAEEEIELDFKDFCNNFVKNLKISYSDLAIISTEQKNGGFRVLVGKKLSESKPNLHFLKSPRKV